MDAEVEQERIEIYMMNPFDMSPFGKLPSPHLMGATDILSDDDSGSAEISEVYRQLGRMKD